MDENLTVREALAKLLSEQKSILNDGRALTDALEKIVAPEHFMELARVRRALVEANIGECFMVADGSDRKARDRAALEATERLKKIHLPPERAKSVVEMFKDVMGWSALDEDSEPVYEEINPPVVKSEPPVVKPEPPVVKPDPPVVKPDPPVTDESKRTIDKPLRIIAGLALLIVCCLFGAMSSASHRLTVAQQEWDNIRPTFERYSDIEKHFGVGSSSYYASKKIVFLESGGSSDKFVVYWKEYDGKHHANLSYSTNVSIEWSAFNGGKSDFKVTSGKNKGYYPLKFANDLNDDKFDVLVIVR